MSKLITVATRVAATVRFAQVINGNGAFTQADRTAAYSNAQAEGVTTFAALRTHMLLDATKGNSELVSLWLRSIEFGDFSDNYEAFTLYQFHIANGETAEGLEQLQLLREHIVAHPDDLKSISHLLPKVDEAIVQATLRHGPNDEVCATRIA
jgi:hypothetical protein